MKKILVTGASSGIGKQITQALLEKGETVIGICRTHPYQHINYQPHVIDLEKIHNLEPLYKNIASQYPDIDAIICCAGYGHFVSLEEFSFDEMKNLFNVNFLSQALLIKILLPHLKQREDAKIIAIGSECALSGQKKGTLYCASKYALRGFMASLREECRQRNVAVSLINPGMVDTPFFDKLDFCFGDQSANAIAVKQVSDMVMLLLSFENNCVVEEINCQPMKKVIKKKYSDSISLP